MWLSWLPSLSNTCWLPSGFAIVIEPSEPIVITLPSANRYIPGVGFPLASVVIPLPPPSPPPPPPVPPPPVPPPPVPPPPVLGNPPVLGFVPPVLVLPPLPAVEVPGKVLPIGLPFLSNTLVWPCPLVTIFEPSGFKITCPPPSNGYTLSSPPMPNIDPIPLVNALNPPLIFILSSNLLTPAIEPLVAASNVPAKFSGES